MRPLLALTAEFPLSILSLTRTKFGEKKS